MAFDERLAARIRDALAAAPELTEKKMFGGLCFLVRGNMCCGVLQSELILRVEPATTADVLQRPHARPMDLTGRAMKGFVVVDLDGLDRDADLRAWLELSLGYVSRLPRKLPKPPKKKRKTTR